MLTVIQSILILTTLACYIIQSVPQQYTLQDSWKVVFDPVELDNPNNTVHIRPQVQSLVQCGSLVLSDPDDFYRLFCMTPAGQCLLSNASYPAYYDDESGGGDYRCYTVVKPLIDRSLYVGTGVCPPPFDNIANVGCVYHYKRFLSFDNFAKARRSCMSYYPECDLYTGSINNELSNYMVAKGALDVYVGAKRQGPGVTVRSDYYWLDGRQTTNAEWTSRIDFLNQPGTFGYYTFIPSSTPDCLILWTNPLLVSPMFMYKLANQWCDEYHEYLCEIKL